MGCCGGCCGGKPSRGTGTGAAATLAGIAAGAVVLIGVFGMGRGGDPVKPTPPATPPVKDKTPSTEQPVKDKPADSAAAKSPLDFKMTGIDGREQDLSQYKGKVVVIVNVASKCGFTEQYFGLQDLYAKHKDEGLVVLGFPANDFGSQEPGTNLEIAQFCASKYNVTFPMFEKITVKGEGMHPLYKVLTSQPAPIGGEPKWNFTKFIIDRNGKVAARFDAEKRFVRSKQIEPDLVKKVEELLAAKKPEQPAATPAPAPSGEPKPPPAK